MAEWLKDCEVCNVALCTEFKRLVKEEELSERAAAKKMVEQQKEALKGEVVYSEKALRDRFRYHTGKVKRKENTGVAESQPPQDAKVVKKERSEIQNRGVTKEATKVWTEIYKDLFSLSERIQEQLKEDSPPSIAKDLAKKLMLKFMEIAKYRDSDIQKVAAQDSGN